MTNDEKDFEQMNRLFAEKIMGWEWDPTWGRCGWYDVGNPNKCQAIMHTFFPCTSIADAWMGVEKLTDEGFYINIYPIYSYGEPDGTGKTVWCAEILGSEVIADTAPLAITTACLLAKGVEV